MEPDPKRPVELYYSCLDRGYDNPPDQTLAYWQSRRLNLLIEGYGMDKMNELPCCEQGQQ